MARTGQQKIPHARQRHRNAARPPVARSFRLPRLRRTHGVVALLVVGAISGWVVLGRLGLQPAQRAAIAALQPISLPDLSPLDALARKQIEAVHARATELRAAADLDRGALGGAYGDFGALLLAYDQPGAPAPLANAETLQPDDARWPYYLGRAYRLAGEFGRAAEAYERALAHNPDDVPAQVRVAQMYRELGRDDEATALLEAALAAAPRTALAHEVLGQIALARDDAAGAIEHFEAVLALQPEASAVHAPLAEAYRQAGRADKQAEHLALLGEVRPTIDDPLETALERSKVGPRAWMAQADVALRNANPAGAVTLYEKVVRDDPGNARAYRNLGVARGQLGDVDGAVRDLETAARIDPADGDIHQLLAEHLARAGRGAESESALERAVASEPQSGAAQIALAESLRAAGRCEEALPHYASGLERLPSEVVGRIQYVFCLVTLGRFQAARDVLEPAIASPPVDPEIVDAMARLLAAAPDDAVRDGLRAVQLAESLQRQRTSIDARETLAMAYAEAGQFTTAIRWQSEAIAMATAEGQSEWLETLNANLARYRRKEPARTLWPPFVLAPGE